MYDMLLSANMGESLITSTSHLLQVFFHLSIIIAAILFRRRNFYFLFHPFITLTGSSLKSFFRREPMRFSIYVHQ